MEQSTDHTYNQFQMTVIPETKEGSAQRQSGDGSIDFLELVLLLVRFRRRIAIATLVSFVIGAAIAFLMRPVYTATALILPPQQQQSSASTLLSSLSILGGAVPGGLLKTPADMYIGILQSNTIADDLIHHFHLESVYGKHTLYDTRAALEKHANFETKKDGLIHISVTDHNPKRASELANGFIDELYHMNSTLAITEAAQRRLFFQEQMEQEKKALTKAENALAQVQVKTGIIQLNGQAEIILRSIAQLQAQITSDEVQLQGLLTSSTEQNPDVKRLRQEITALQSQLGKLQDRQGSLQPGNTQIPTGRLPKDALDYMRKLRDVRYNETLYNLLSKQYEAARIDEAKSAPLIQIVDRAVPPDKRSGPPRTLIILAFGFAGFVMACLWGLCKDVIIRMSTLPEYQEKIAQLKASFHGSK